MKMKNLKLFPILMAIVVMACDDDDLAPRDQKINDLTSSSWVSPTVTHADGNLSDQYTDFVLVFNNNPSNGFEGSFIIANGGYAFAESSGKWKLSDDLTTIILDSGKELSAEVSEQSLRLEFTV